MFRAILSALCLCAVVGFVSAEAKAEKKEGTVTGKFDSYKDGKLTILVGKKDDAKPMVYEVKGDVKVSVFAGKESTEVVAKDAFGEKLEKGTKVTLTLDSDKKITKIEVGKKKN